MRHPFRSNFTCSCLRSETDHLCSLQLNCMSDALFHYISSILASEELTTWLHVACTSALCLSLVFASITLLLTPTPFALHLFATREFIHSMYSQNNVWIKCKAFHFGLKATQRRLQLSYQAERLTYMLGYVSSVAARQKDLFMITPRTRTCEPLTTKDPPRF